VHNGIELSFENVLIVMIGLVMTWWMSRAPRSFLKLLSTRIPGLDRDRPWVNSIVRWWGRSTFFTLVCGMLMMFTPNSLANTAGFSLVTMLLAAGISVFVLKKKSQKEEDLYSVALRSEPQAGSGRPTI
jgi:hypothetical protein